jgi:dienelactone hydrolase
MRFIAFALSCALTVPAAAQTPAFVKETAADLPGYNIYRPADLATRRRPAPVIVWANGGCVKRDLTWSTLFERWAGAGYVVVTIHDPNAPMGIPQAGAAAAGSRPGVPPPAVVGQQARDTAAAQGRAIDWATGANAAKGGAYRGKLDLSRVVAAGNSCGGISSLTLASQDKRPKAVFVLSGSSIGPGAKAEVVQPVMSKVAVPAIWVVGGPEDIARAAADMDYSFQPAGTPGVVVYRSSFDHRTLSTDPGSLHDAAEIGLNWFKATLYGDRAAAAELTTKVCASCDAKTWTVKAKNLSR